MASPSTVLTLGLGGFSNASLLITLGFGLGEPPYPGNPEVFSDLAPIKVFDYLCNSASNILTNEATIVTVRRTFSDIVER